MHRGPVMYLGATTAFAAGAVVAGALLGEGLGRLGDLLRTSVDLRWFAAALAIAAMAYSAADLSRIQLPVPQVRWQVPRSWANWGLIKYAALFGAILGLGMITFVPFAGYWLVLSAAVVRADPTGGALALGAFGAGRALPAVLTPLVARVTHTSWQSSVLRASAYLGSASLVPRSIRLFSLSLLVGLFVGAAIN